MFRRKLAAFTISFAAGISAGFFLFDRSRTLEASGFILSVMAVIIFFDDKKKNKLIKETLAAFFLCGFLLFALRSSYYDNASGYSGTIATVTAKVLAAELKDDDLKMTVRTSGPHRQKIQVTIPGYTPGAHDKEHEISAPAPYELTGALLEITGELNEFDPADDPGCFDYRLHMRGKGMCLSLKAYSFEIIDLGNSISIKAKRFLFRTREDFLRAFDEETAGFIKGVIFGDKSEIDEDTVREFNENSTAHILAVSGLHVGFLYGLLRFLTGRRKTAGVSALVIAVIVIYGEMTMWSAATVRACLVMTVSLMSLHFRRRFDLLTSVSLSALLILLKEPYQLFSSGFQLSFLAMCGIAFFAKPVSSVTGEALGVMAAVQAGTLPVTAYSFCRFDLLAVFINIPVILLASVLVPLCLLMLMSLIVFGAYPAMGTQLIELISDAVMKINHVLHFGGAFSIKTAGIGGASVIAVYIILLGLTSEWARVNFLRRRPGEILPAEILKKGVLFMMPVLMLASCFYDPFLNDEIVFVAVGQGDCVHVKAGGRDLLIDGGGSDYYNVGEKILMPYLLHEGSEHTELALVTHLHTDHYKGIQELAKIYPVGALGVPADYKGSLEGSRPDDDSHYDSRLDDKYLESSGLGFDPDKIIYIEPHTKISMSDDVYVESIWPVKKSDKPVAADDPNEHNAVYMIHYRDIKVMVTGDLLEDDELKMVEYYKGTDILKCDVLKVAHHGSKSSSSEVFLDAASPSIAVIQVGRNNMYGHPHKQTLERLEARGIRAFRTDESGAVGIDIRNGRISVDLYRHPDQN